MTTSNNTNQSNPTPLNTSEYTVNRVEVIDHVEGRVYTKWEDYDFEVVFDQQDDGRTLKIFLLPVAETVS